MRVGHAVLGGRCIADECGGLRTVEAGRNTLGNCAVDRSIELLAPATGSTLVARGTALTAGRTLSVAEGKVRWTVRNFAATTDRAAR
jgi:acyl-coenzyme A thioesterase PaaI-like protein